MIRADPHPGRDVAAATLPPWWRWGALLAGIAYLLLGRVFVAAVPGLGLAVGALFLLLGAAGLLLARALPAPPAAELSGPARADGASSPPAA